MRSTSNTKFLPALLLAFVVFTFVTPPVTIRASSHVTVYNEGTNTAFVHLDTYWAGNYNANIGEDNIPPGGYKRFDGGSDPGWTTPPANNWFQVYCTGYTSGHITGQQGNAMEYTKSVKCNGSSSGGTNFCTGLKYQNNSMQPQIGVVTACGTVLNPQPGTEAGLSCNGNPAFYIPPGSAFNFSYCSTNGPCNVSMQLYDMDCNPMNSVAGTNTTDNFPPVPPIQTPTNNYDFGTNMFMSPGTNLLRDLGNLAGGLGDGLSDIQLKLWKMNNLLLNLSPGGSGSDPCCCGDIVVNTSNTVIANVAVDISAVTQSVMHAEASLLTQLKTNAAYTQKVGWAVDTNTAFFKAIWDQAQSYIAQIPEVSAIVPNSDAASMQQAGMDTYGDSGLPQALQQGEGGAASIAEFAGAPVELTWDEINLGPSLAGGQSATMMLDPFAGDWGTVWDWIRRLTAWGMAAMYLFAVLARTWDVVVLGGTSQQFRIPQIEVSFAGFGGNFGAALAVVALPLLLILVATLFAVAASNMFVTYGVCDLLFVNPLSTGTTGGNGIGGGILRGIGMLMRAFPFDFGFALVSSYLTWRLTTIAGGAVYVATVKAIAG